LDLSLIAADVATKGIDWAGWGYLAQGIVALGLVILIHEFGHFAAAKLCGVKVEKFYIGFDFFGLRFFRFKWGETEYGLGVFPLGGYVYMLGQTDNPAKQAEEAERAKAAAAAGQPVDPEAAAPWDPRSYPAQSVPERMFIISAGVIMNTITAVLFAVWAYTLGVQYLPTYITDVVPGSPAWTKGLAIGDEITEIDGIKKPRWDYDLVGRVPLADLTKGIDFKIKRPGRDGEFDLNIVPRQDNKKRPPTIGVGPPGSTKLNEKEPTLAGTPAARAEPKFIGGDVVIAMNDRPIAAYGDVAAALTDFIDQKIAVKVRRTEKDAPKDAKPQELTIDVAPRPLRTLGLTMEIGPVTAVQDDSPAAKAGLQAGDLIRTLDGAPIGDPMTLGERLHKRAATGEKNVRLGIERTVGGKVETKEFPATLLAGRPYEATIREGTPASIPALGVAYKVSTKIAAVDPAGPAAASGLKPGDVVTACEFVPQDEAAKKEEQQGGASLKVELTEVSADNWPHLQAQLQYLLPTTKVKLTTADGRTAEFAPADSRDAYYAARGFRFDMLRDVRIAESFAEAVRLGIHQTGEDMTKVYRFLQKIGGQIPVSSMGSIIEITSQAGAAASIGFSHLLMFLTMLSANLAVLNFLPFPVLDGGHMCFLIYEAIFRKPPPERVVIALNIFGLVCLLSLMGIAMTNDILRRL
jgi:regulator of sigma E protease